MLHKTSVFVLLLFCFLVSSKSYGQIERDTLFYKIKPEMIARARIGETSFNKTNYYIYVHLKKEYHQELAQLTGSNIDNYFAVTYKDEIISPILPVIKAKLTGGNFSIGSFKKEKDARKVLQSILKEDKQ